MLGDSFSMSHGLCLLNFPIRQIMETLVGLIAAPEASQTLQKLYDCKVWHTSGVISTHLEVAGVRICEPAFDIHSCAGPQVSAAREIKLHKDARLHYTVCLTALYRKHGNDLPDHERRLLTELLVLGLADRNEKIRALLLSFWDHEANLPGGSPLR